MNSVSLSWQKGFSMVQSHPSQQTVMPLSPTSTQPTTLTATIERILASGKITRADQHIFRAAFLAEQSLSETEEIMINWMFDNLRRGTAIVVD